MLGPFLFLLLAAASPAQADKIDLAAAERLFLDTCASCHGDQGESPTGGGIAGVSRRDVARAVRGADQMPAIDLTEAQIDAIAVWLAVLGTAP
jgi:mono/diheme cytochrome c family protein